MFFLQAFDILKEAASLSDAVLHDVQSVSSLWEVCFLVVFVNSKTQTISSSFGSVILQRLHKNRITLHTNATSYKYHNAIGLDNPEGQRSNDQSVEPGKV